MAGKQLPPEPKEGICPRCWRPLDDHNWLPLAGDQRPLCPEKKKEK